MFRAYSFFVEKSLKTINFQHIFHFATNLKQFFVWRNFILFFDIFYLEFLYFGIIFFQFVLFLLRFCLEFLRFVLFFPAVLLGISAFCADFLLWFLLGISALYAIFSAFFA